MDKAVLKESFKLLGKYLVAVTMSIIVTVSFFMLFAATAGEDGVISGAPFAVMLILSEICSLGTLIMFINGKVYYIGDSDANRVQFGHAEYDKFKGLKLGIVPGTFAFITWAVLLLGKLGVAKDWAYLIFSFTNYHLFGYHQVIFGRSTNLNEISWLGIIAAFLTVVLVPLVSHICYTLGYKRINLFEKVVFKKKGDK